MDKCLQKFSGLMTWGAINNIIFTDKYMLLQVLWALMRWDNINNLLFLLRNLCKCSGLLQDAAP